MFIIMFTIINIIIIFIIMIIIKNIEYIIAFALNRTNPFPSYIPQIPLILSSIIANSKLLLPCFPSLA